MSVSIQVRPFTLFFGAFDATDYLNALTISAPHFEMDGALIWTGSFEVGFNRKAQARGLTAAAFDPLTNPSVWRPGQQPVTLKIQGYPLPVLRVDRYVYNSETNKGQGTFTQILLAIEGDRPAVEPEIAIGQQTPISEVVGLLLAGGFATSREQSLIVLSGLTGVIDSKISTRNPIADAQKLCGLNWQWLTVDGAETVRTVSGDPATNPILFQRALSQLPAGGWEPDLDAIHFASEKVIISGSHQVPGNPDCSDGREIPGNADEKGRVYYNETASTAPFETLFPGRTEYARDSLIPSERKETFYCYADRPYFISGAFGGASPSQTYTLYSFAGMTGAGAIADWIAEGLRNRNKEAEGEGPIATLTHTKQPYAKVFAGARFSAELVTSSVTFECAAFNATFVPRGLLFAAEVQSSLLDGTRIYPQDLYPSQIERRETKDMPKGQPHSSQIDPKTGRPQCLEKQPQPAPIEKAPEIPMETEVIRAEAIIQPNGWVPLHQKPLAIDLGFIPSQGHADNIARQIAFREVRRRDAVQITMPLPIEWLMAGCPLLGRCLVHDGEFQIDAPIVDLKGDQLTFSFSGGRIRRLAVSIEGPSLPAPYIPGGSRLQVPAIIPATIGVPIQPVNLPVGATSTDLPAGLSISASGVLSGAASVGVGPIVFTVSAGGGTAPITLNVGGVPIGGEPVSESVKVRTGAAISWKILGSEARFVKPKSKIGWRLSDRAINLKISRIKLGSRFRQMEAEAFRRGTAIRWRMPSAEVIDQSYRRTFGVRYRAPFAGTFNAAIAPLNGRSGLTLRKVSGTSFDLFSLPFAFPVFGGYSFQLLCTYNAGQLQANLLLINLDAGSRSTDAIYAGILSEGSYTIRWEGRIISTGVALIREATFFEDGAILLVSAVTAQDGSLSDWRQSSFGAINPINWIPNSSIVMLPQSGGYQVVTGSYS
jgi:hypothetical protein